MRLALCILLSGCQAQRPAVQGAVDTKVDTLVDLGDQKLDLAPFLTGFPYTPLLPLWDRGVLLVDHQGSTRSLRAVSAELDGAPPDLDDAQAISPIDWDTRNRWGLRHHAASDMLYWQGDAVNDEKIDLWRMPATGGEAERLTDEPYLYGFSFSPDESELVLLPRRGEGPFESCVERMDPTTGTRTPVLCDSPAATLTWGMPSWAPDARGVLVNVSLESQRSRRNLAWIDFEAPSMRLLLDPAPARRTAFALDTWLDEHTAVIVVDDGDRERIEALDIRTGETRRVWAPKQELAHVEIVEPDGQARLVAIEHSPVQDAAHLIDPTSGAVLASTVFDGSTRWLGDDDHGRALIAITSAATPMDTALLGIGTSTLTQRPWLGLPEPTRDAMLACQVERVAIPTFDVDPATGEQRQLHAFLYTPAEGGDPASMPVRITAFYGGSNRFSADTQIHCAAGVATLSPAVRGSRGFGPAFYALNDGDLGGDEFIDLFEAGRFLEGKGFSRGKIGVYGGSHGGYATMRALTYPPGTNGHPDSALYPFAFGVSRAGFSDIITFHDTCNIPDWVLLEAGDPKTEADKLRDRSPLTHVSKLEAPLLLIHGENDSRVPVAESRQMAFACQEQGKDCVYVEFPNMGHHIKGLANQRVQYQATFDLIRRATASE